MSDPGKFIDPYTASPPDFLSWLQQVAAEHPSAFGSWRSRVASESLRNPEAFEARLESWMDDMRNSFIDAEAKRREDTERSLSDYAKRLLNEQFPDNVGNRAYHLTLVDLVADAKEAINRLGYEVPKDVAFGVLPTGQVNGRACAVPAGGLIVAIDDGLFNFAYSLAKAIATLCEVTVTENADGVLDVDVSWIDNDIARSLENNEDANRRWLEILFATFILAHPNQVPMRPLLGDRAYLSTVLTTAVEFFVVAHEFGHLILGHYERNHMTSKQMLPGGVEVDEFETARAEELEADRIGLELLRDYHKSLGLSLDNTRWAVWFWAGCLNVMELMYGGPSRTHPSAGERGTRLLELLAREDGSTIDTPSLGLDIYNVMGGLWSHNQQRFVEWVRRAESDEMPYDIA
jgi:hypothetical protein